MSSGREPQPQQPAEAQAPASIPTPAPDPAAEPVPPQPYASAAAPAAPAAPAFAPADPTVPVFAAPPPAAAAPADFAPAAVPPTFPGPPAFPDPAAYPGAGADSATTAFPLVGAAFPAPGAPGAPYPGQPAALQFLGYDQNGQPLFAPPPGAPGQPWGVPFPPPPQPKKSRTALIVGCTVGAAVIAGLVTAGLIADGRKNNIPTAADTPSSAAAGASSAASLPASAAASASAAAAPAISWAIPQTAGPLVELTNSVASTAAGSVQTNLAKVNDQYADIQAAAYGTSADGSVVAILAGEDTGQAYQINAALTTGSTPAQIVAAGAVENGLTDTQTEAATPGGGAMACGAAPSSGFNMCIWVDVNTVGFVFVPDSSSMSETATYAEALAAAVEKVG